MIEEDNRIKVDIIENINIGNSLGQQNSSLKVLATVVSDIEDILLIDFLPSKQAIT